MKVESIHKNFFENVQAINKVRPAARDSDTEERMFGYLEGKSKEFVGTLYMDAMKFCENMSPKDRLLFLSQIGYYAYFAIYDFTSKESEGTKTQFLFLVSDSLADLYFFDLWDELKDMVVQGDQLVTSLVRDQLDKPDEQFEDFRSKFYKRLYAIVGKDGWFKDIGGWTKMD